MTYHPLLTNSSSSEAIILANGNYPTHSLPLALLQNTPYVVCCDGAANEYIRRGNRPHAIVGDGDSISEEYKNSFAGIGSYSNDQETNDQTKAVNFCLEQGIKDIIIVGATGKREDHSLGNISLLMDYPETVRIQMVTDYGFFTPACNDGCFRCYPGQQISIFNFGATAIRGENLRYPLRDFTNWWQGTLNETLAEEFKIYAQGRYLIYRAFPAKNHR